MIVDVGVWVSSTVMVTLGVFLFLFGVLDFSPEARTRTILLLFLVPVAIFVLIRVGRAIIRDLRGR